MAGNKENSTFRIDKDIKRDFKIECVLAVVEMSEAVESLMSSFIKTSREIRLNKIKGD